MRTSFYEAATNFAVRSLPPARFAAWRDRYFGLRARMRPILRAVHGSFDSAALRAHLEHRIGHRFEILMVHSSVNHMRPMYDDDPLAFVRMLIDYVGPDRTLVMPAFYFGDPDIGGAGPTFEQNPRFDVRRTPSQMGLATELFRRMRGVRQSRHPIYRISALGPLAEALTTGHEAAESACGRGSPFDFMTAHDTLILGIGKPFEVLTHVHHAEELLGKDFPVTRSAGADLAMTLIDGEEEIAITLHRGGFTGKRNMWKLRDIMGPDRLLEWRFHNVDLFAVRAREITGALLDAAGRGITLFEST
jgi:aminoglycoside 3-N-acetyltransferase